VRCGTASALISAWGSIWFGGVLALSVLAPTARAHDTGWAWPYATLTLRIAKHSVTLPDRRVRVDRDLVICKGEGKPVRRAGLPRWKHFTCTQTIFTRSRVGRDVTFRVHVLGRTRLLITDPRYGPDSRRSAVNAWYARERPKGLGSLREPAAIDRASTATRSRSRLGDVRSEAVDAIRLA
jgi:hypothetical protein